MVEVKEKPASTVWFSASLQYVIRIEGSEEIDACESVIVLKARDFDNAFDRALEIGRTRQASYANGEGNEVSWILTRVATVDMLGETIPDGREIYSRLSDVPLDQRDQYPAKFSPESWKPTQTGV